MNLNIYLYLLVLWACTYDTASDKMENEKQQ